MQANNGTLQKTSSNDWHIKFSKLSNDTLNELRFFQNRLTEAGGRDRYHAMIEHPEFMRSARAELAACLSRLTACDLKATQLMNAPPKNVSASELLQIQQVSKIIKDLHHEVALSSEISHGRRPLDFSQLSIDQLEELIDFTLPPRRHFMNVYQSNRSEK